MFRNYKYPVSRKHSFSTNAVKTLQWSTFKKNPSFPIIFFAENASNFINFQHLREVTQLTRIHLSLANLIFSPLSRVISKTKPPPGTSLSILPQTHLCPRRDASAQFTTLGRTASRVIRGLCIRGRFTRTPPLNGGLACVHHGNIV